jgi:hypothetical protein
LKKEAPLLREAGGTGAIRPSRPAPRPRTSVRGRGAEGRSSRWSGIDSLAECRGALLGIRVGRLTSYYATKDWGCADARFGIMLLGRKPPAFGRAEK